MRTGDFAIEVVPHAGGSVRELESGHVLARPGQVYVLRLCNHGPLRCLVEVAVDSQGVTGGGLVLEPYATCDLERPVEDGEHGRFTVVAEGDERVFGPDGGRDDPSLGVIEARFRRELPRARDHDHVPRPIFGRPEPTPAPLPPTPPHPSRLPFPIDWSARVDGALHGALHGALDGPMPTVASALPPAAHRIGAPPPDRRPAAPPEAAIERAAGTGLTGRSAQHFVPTTVGPLEREATVLQLRLVIGSEAALAESPPRPLAGRRAPARPAARP